MSEIIETLRSADNEVTSAPYWLIIDPNQLGLSWEDGGETIFADLDEDNCGKVGEYIPYCITGPFFSRQDADDHLKARRYAFSNKAYVYCFSGFRSQKYVDFYNSAVKGRTCE